MLKELLFRVESSKKNYAKSEENTMGIFTRAYQFVFILKCFILATVFIFLCLISFVEKQLNKFNNLLIL